MWLPYCSSVSHNAAHRLHCLQLISPLLYMIFCFIQQKNESVYAFVIIITLFFDLRKILSNGPACAIPLGLHKRITKTLGRSLLPLAASPRSPVNCFQNGRRTFLRHLIKYVYRYYALENSRIGISVITQKNTSILTDTGVV